MNIELVNNNGQFEIWAGKEHVSDIRRIKGETLAVYEKRANDFFERYVERLKEIKDRQKPNRIVKSVSI